MINSIKFLGVIHLVRTEKMEKMKAIIQNCILNISTLKIFWNIVTKCWSILKPDRKSAVEINMYWAKGTFKKCLHNRQVEEHMWKSAFMQILETFFLFYQITMNCYITITVSLLKIHISTFHGLNFTFHLSWFKFPIPPFMVQISPFTFQY